MGIDLHIFFIANNKYVSYIIYIFNKNVIDAPTDFRLWVIAIAMASN